MRIAGPSRSATSDNAPSCSRKTTRAGSSTRSRSPRKPAIEELVGKRDLGREIERQHGALIDDPDRRGDQIELYVDRLRERERNTRRRAHDWAVLRQITRRITKRQRPAAAEIGAVFDHRP